MVGGQQVLTLWFAEGSTCWITWRWEGEEDAHASRLDPALRQTLLNFYEQALPNARPAESAEEALNRALSGPLASPQESADFGARLADGLLPTELTQALIRRSGNGAERVCMKIHVSPTAARIPWGLLRIQTEAAGNQRALLLDFAYVAIAIPRNASRLAKRRDKEASRLRVNGTRRGVVAVIDPKVPGYPPTSALGSVLGPPQDNDELAALLGRRTGNLIPTATVFSELARRSDLDRRWLKSVLPKASAFLYVGHVSVGQDLTSSGASSALHLCCVDDTGQHDPLTAGEILSDEEFVFPEHVAFIGCGSGTDHTFLEPMGLSLAAHLRGAQYVIAASWTIPTDSYLPSTPLRRLILAADEALDSSNPARAMNLWQRDRAEAWFRDGHVKDTPLLWAAMHTFVR
ncbi:CHAT domain-containing protein [Corynebacterium aurimucosum]|uniref:CHAT domain-containing protein n=1 Tax=Corynebacterium aurimucosum TaxID=169292 RepID=A0A6I3K9S3_9CORY|nr:CHAT domain-containing protein [Corynebacterium aurimucosum]